MGEGPLPFAYCMPGPVARSDARPTGIEEVAGSILWTDNILSWRLVMKSFVLRPFSPLPNTDSSRAFVSYWQKDVH